MKKELLLITLLLGAALFIFLPKEEKAALVQRPEKASLQSTKKLFLGARPGTLKPVAEITQQDTCGPLLEELNQIDFTLPPEDWRDQLTLETAKKCADPSVNSKLAELMSACFEKRDDNQCVINAAMLRSLLRVRGIRDSDDKEGIADLVLSEFSKKTPDFKKLQKLAEKLMALEPGELSFEKLWVGSKLIDLMESKRSPAEITDEILGRVDPDLWKDDQLRSMLLAIRSGLNPIGVEHVAREMLEEKADAGMHEILGWSLWKQNRRAEAIQQLERAMKLNPADSYLTEQYKRLKSRNATIDSYQARISLGFQLEDLFN